MKYALLRRTLDIWPIREVDVDEPVRECVGSIELKDYEGRLSDLIGELQALAANAADATVKVTADDDDGCVYNITLDAYSVRPPTEEERAERERRNRAARKHNAELEAKRLEKERAEYERLKAKFG